MSHFRALRTLCILFGGLSAAAQQDRYATPVEAPQVLRLQPSRAALVFDYEHKTVKNNREDEASTKEVNEYFEPGVQLGARGSIYHSSLLEFNLAGEFARQRQEYDYEGFSGPGGASSGVDKTTLQRYDFQATLLKLKPYAINLQAIRQDFERHQDFFTREDVNSTLWSAQGGYRTIEKELSIRYEETSENITGGREYEREEKVLHLAANRRVDKDLSTELNYNLRDILHTREEFTQQDGQIHEVRLVDRRLLSREELARLYSSATYTDQNTTSVPSQRINWNEKLDLRHQDYLRSTHQLRFSQRTTGDTETQSYLGRSMLEHKLYESLVSTADAEGNFTSNDAGDSDSNQSQVRAGIDESYTKKLSSDSVLNLGAAFHAWQTQTEYSATEGLDSSETLSESLVLSNTSPVVLSRPSADASSIVVTDASGGRVYEEGLDYRVVNRGGFTEIQRVIGGEIPNGSTVQVEYNSGGRTSDHFWTAETVYSFRLTLFDNWLMLNARQEDLQNHGNESTQFPTFTRTVYGAEAGPQWAKSGFEVDDNDSSDFPYRARRLYEYVTIALPLNSTFSLDLGKTWRTYEENGDEDTLELIGHLNSQLSGALSFGVAGGYLQEHRPTEDRDRTTFQADMHYRYGKLELSSGYDYNVDNLRQETRDEHKIWVHTKRWF